MTMNPNIPGKYVHKKNRPHYIELKPDGTYLLYESSVVTGTFEVDESDIKIIGAESTSIGKIKDGVIIDSEGEKWVRAKTASAVSDDPLASMTWIPPVFRRHDFPWELVDLAGLLLMFIVALLIARA